MHRKSFFKIKLDYARSQGSFLYDLNRQQEILDLFGLYSSLPLGYNHPIFSDPGFVEAIRVAAPVKIPNNEMATVPADEFLEIFSQHPSMKPFSYFHFTCTGALAIEAALKTAFDYRKPKNRPQVIGFKQSFHGINSYGGFITDRVGSVRHRLDGFPGPFAIHMDNPVIRYENNRPVTDRALRERVSSEIRNLLARDKDRDIVAVLVEPIQCTAGDWVMDPEFLRTLRAFCTEFDTPLIFDEIQTGFGGTGTLWYFEQCGFVPDIVAFGKKTQTSGIMVQERFAAIFSRPVRLEVTWDGDVLDMIRCRYILEAYKRYSILDNVKRRGAAIASALRRDPALLNVRQTGLLIAFDFPYTGDRDRYVRMMVDQEHAIVSSTQEKTVRWRPNLAFSEAEMTDALERSSRVTARALA